MWRRGTQGVAQEEKDVGEGSDFTIAVDVERGGANQLAAGGRGLEDLQLKSAGVCAVAVDHDDVVDAGDRLEGDALRNATTTGVVDADAITEQAGTGVLVDDETEVVALGG